MPGHRQYGFSTGPETTGNNRHVPDNRDTRQAVRPQSRTARLPHLDRIKPQVRLPDVQPGDRPADDHPLDLRGALEDREDRGLADSFRRSAACGGRGISTDSAPDSRGWRRFWSARGRPQHDGQRRPKARYRPSDDPKFPATGATSTGTSKVHLLTDLPSGLRAGGEPYSEGAGSRRSSAKTRTKRAMSSGGSTRPCLSSRFAIPQMERPGRRAADRDVCAGRVLAGAKRRLLELEGDRVGAAVVEAEAELLAGARPGL